MKNNLIKFYSTLLFFFISFMLFAGIGDESDDPTMEDPEIPAAPIDSRIFILAVFGIVFAIYSFRSSKETE